MLGVATTACGLAGIGDDNRDAGRPRLRRGRSARSWPRWPGGGVSPPERGPPPAGVFAGIGLLWTVLVLFGAAVYAGTGALARIDDALVESAAGFTTTSVTLLDAAEASRATLLFRAATSWVGGLMAILIGVVTLPAVLKSTALIGYSSGAQGDGPRVPGPTLGPAGCSSCTPASPRPAWVAYSLTGLGATEALVVGLGTASTGGFTGRADSLAGYGTSTQAVAAAGMFLAGAGVFVLWWIARGRLRPMWRSQELRTYALLLAAATAAVAVHRGVGWGEAGFMAVVDDEHHRIRGGGLDRVGGFGHDG